jgi:hypothetical protein
VKILINKIFVICPIGSADSNERKQSDNLMEFVIEKAISNMAMNCQIIRADKIAEPGRITKQIAKEIAESDLVIADLSGLNANVMYELGVRHGLRKPCILMTNQGQSLPFDLLDLRTIFYELSLSGAKKACQDLESQIKSVLDGRVDLIEYLTNADDNSSNPDPDRDPSELDLLLTLLDSNAHMSREIDELKELVRLVGGIVVELRDSKDKEVEVKTQEMAINFLSSMMTQGIQNPDGFQQIMSIFQKLQENSPTVENDKQATIPSEDTSSN